MSFNRVFREAVQVVVMPEPQTLVQIRQRHFPRREASLLHTVLTTLVSFGKIKADCEWQGGDRVLTYRANGTHDMQQNKEQAI